MGEFGGLLILLAIGLVGTIILLRLIPVNLWLSAIFSGVRVSLFSLVGMRLRRVPPRLILESMITASKAGLSEVTLEGLETHYLAGGNVPSVIKALISADKANIELTFQQAAAIDLAGRDVFEAVQISVNPQVISTPAVAAVAQDGIQLIAKARVTVRANISQLVGGSGEDTILARVGEGIVTSVGSAVSHKDVLENPDRISKIVLEKGLDVGTAFEILSIDIADIDIGENIGAKLQIDQANADLKVAEAKAEERRAMAVAVEQEMRAKAQSARARVIEAEAEVPKSIAYALRNGNIGIMDHYRMQNIKSDTDMRDAIANPNMPVNSKKNRNQDEDNDPNTKN
ncbi:MAG: flotillin-like protein FloA [Bernardetiaceae bacterium]|nr:flotillin-like protein FloA [Bernardetiaceae bacterium]